MKKKIIATLTMLLIGLISINKVNASTTYSWTTKQSRLYLDQQGTETTTSWETIPHTFSPSYPVSQMQYRLQYSGGLSAGNTYKFKISFLPNPDAINSSGIWFSDGTTTLTEVNCSGWARESNNYYANVCAISPESDISSSGYLYVRIVFNSTYVNTIRSYVGDFEETKGIGAIIQDGAIDIMNNQNENTKAIIEANQVCNYVDKANVISWGKYIAGYNGQVFDTTNTNKGVTDYIKITNKDTLKIITSNNYEDALVFYNTNKEYISRVIVSNYNNQEVTIPNNTSYIRLTIEKTSNKPTLYICKNGSKALQDTLDQEHEYNNNPNRDTTTENNELTSYEQEEQQLLNSLNLNIEDAEVTINGNASSFIWEIINRIRETSGKIVLLFTSILSLGIMKMILGR